VTGASDPPTVVGTAEPPVADQDAPAPTGGRRPPRRVVLAIAAAIAAVVIVVWIVAFSPVLGVKSISVRGTGFLTSAEVRTAAAIKHGTPLLRLDTGAVVRRVERLPEVRSATVSTSYPNSVTITVEERKPVGFVDAGNGALALVDATGMRFRTVHARPKKLPLLVVPTGPQAAASAAACAQVAGDLPADLLSRIQSIQALDPSAITLLLTDSRVVRWGSADRSADKARILPTLLTRPGTQFDVSNPDLVVTR
jgi:cell division protein FtsQ